MQHESLTVDQKLYHQLRSCGHFLRFQTGGKGGQRRILNLLAERGSMTQRALMDLVDVRSGSLSEILGKIEDQGFITRQPNEQDKRNMDISLTEAGKAKAGAMRAENEALVSSLFSGLSDEEKQQLSALHERLRVSWEAQGRFAADSHHGHGPHRHGHGGCKHPSQGSHNAHIRTDEKE